MMKMVMVITAVKTMNTYDNGQRRPTLGSEIAVIYPMSHSDFSRG